jgi:hypothetical protein
MQKLKRHREEAPPRLGRAVPPAVAEVVRRCLAKRPEDRLQTPAELAAALDAAAGRPDWRRWFLVAAAGAFALAVVAVFGTVLLIGLRLSRTPSPVDGPRSVRPAPPTREATGIADGGFATPGVVPNGMYMYAPLGTPWSFEGNSGIESDGSAWAAEPAPDGDRRAAFIQGNPRERRGELGTISQSLYLVPGTYTVSFQAARRAGQVQPIQFSVDGRNVGSTITPTSSAWATYTTASFTIRKEGNHTIQFAATTNDGDHSTFIDAVSISLGGKLLRR